MIAYKELFIGVFWFLMAHLVTFYQLNGQFFKSTDWFRKNEFILACFGLIISYFYIWGTKHSVQGFDGLLWPARFIGFGVGIIIYALLVNYHFGETLTPKTLVSLGIALILICIQVLWK